MEIEVKQKVNVPISPFCKNCFRKTRDEYNDTVCTLFNRYITIHKGNFLKCRECYMALYNAIEKEY